MTYIPSTSRLGMARLRSVAQLERAMRARDVNGRELARAAATSAQTVSQLRTGDRLRVRADIARRLEQALHVGRGSIFVRELDQKFVPGRADPGPETREPGRLTPSPPARSPPARSRVRQPVANHGEARPIPDREQCQPTFAALAARRSSHVQSPHRALPGPDRDHHSG